MKLLNSNISLLTINSNARKLVPLPLIFFMIKQKLQNDVSTNRYFDKNYCDVNEIFF